MIVLLSPAKLMNFDDIRDDLPLTKPMLLPDTKALSDVTKTLSADDLSNLMRISDDLANLNRKRFLAFKKSPFPVGAKHAALAFNGDVYLGLKAAEWTDEDFNYAQNRLRILSGLYGILRPLDAIQAYRLEMGTRLTTDRGRSLYQFWGDKIARELNKACSACPNPFILNLASNEYFKAVDRKTLKYPVVTVAFREEKDGQSKMLMVYAKQARGMMAKWAIENRIESIDQLKNFNVAGYKFIPSQSEELTWTFSRPQPLPKKAA